MTSAKFREWLALHYGCKQPRQAFVKDFNAIARAVGGRPISWEVVSKWMYERPLPGMVGQISFERALWLIAEQRMRTKPIRRIYVITLIADEGMEQEIERRAWASGCKGEEWLLQTLLATVNDSRHA